MDEYERVPCGIREVQSSSSLRQCTKRCGDCLGRSNGIHGRWKVWVRVEYTDEFSWGDTPVVVAPDARNLIECLVDGAGTVEMRHTRQRLIVGSPIPERRGEFLHPEGGLGILEGAHGMRG